MFGVSIENRPEDCNFCRSAIEIGSLFSLVSFPALLSSLINPISTLFDLRNVLSFMILMFLSLGGCVRNLLIPALSPVKADFE